MEYLPFPDTDTGMTALMTLVSIMAAQIVQLAFIAHFHFVDREQA